jgi:hypothetical protein
MNPQRRAFLALAATGALAGAAQAQTAETTASRLSSSSAPARGTVSAAPESVVFSGQAKISSRFAPDPDFGSPHVIVTIDLRGITGVGSQSRAVYTVSEVEVVQRRLAPTHRLEVTFPYARSGEQRVPQTGVAIVDLDFDVATGALTRSAASITTPNFGR